MITIHWRITGHWAKRYSSFFFLQFEFMYLEDTHARMQIWLWSTSLWAMFRSKKDVPFRWHHCEVPHSAYHRWGTAMAIAPISSSFHLCFLILIARVASADILQLCCYCCFSDSELEQELTSEHFSSSLLEKRPSMCCQYVHFWRGFPKNYGKFLFLSIISLSCQKVFGTPPEICFHKFC